jgi:hypothetical protein
MKSMGTKTYCTFIADQKINALPFVFKALSIKNTHFTFVCIATWGDTTPSHGEGAPLSLLIII